MFLDLAAGRLIEPLTGREWDRPEILRRLDARIGHYVGRGLARGDRVFIHFGNTAEFFVDLLAVWSLGGCTVPIDSRFTPFEIETLAKWARPRFSLWDRTPESGIASSLSALGVDVVDVSGGAPAAATPRVAPSRGSPAGFSPRGWRGDRTRGGAEAPGPAAAKQLHLDDDALILFTSGTTGEPKGVVHTHRSLRARWMSLRASLGVEPFRRTLCLLPTHFGHGLICNCLFPWLSGRDLFILPPFKADLVSQLGTIVDEHGITFMSSVPSVWRLALRIAKPPGGRTLDRVFVGSAPLSASLWRSVQEWSGTTNVYNAYGITETGSWLAGTTVPEFTPEDGLVGVAWGGVVKVMNSGSPPFDANDECASGESGHVWVNTPALMRGYLDRDDLTEKVVSMGWFSTGDIGVIDTRGRLYLRGREREEINKGGMKVYPADVDSVVERFPSTVDVCTFAYAEPLLGEDVGVAVVLKTKDPETLRELHRWTSRHLAQHQIPQRWYVVDEIARTSRGKVNRSHVAERCAALAPMDIVSLLRGAPRKDAGGQPTP